MTLPQRIDNIETAIFDYEVANVANNIANVFYEIVDGRIIDVDNPEVMGRFNLVMGACLSAMQKKDYLLLADQLEYELKPMIRGRM